MAELELRKSRELADYQRRLALIVDSSQDAIIGKNLDGIVTHWNKGAQEIYGYTAQEMIGRHISTLAPEDKADEITEILRRIRNGERVGYFESVRVTKDKRKLNVSISVSPIYDSDGKVVGASTIARNITAQKKTEEQLRQSQKMEAIGRLAGGVAHDFNNLLGIVTACSELLRRKVPDAEGAEYLQNIREAAKRGAALTRQLLAFSRRQPVQRQLLDLNERLREVRKLLVPLMGDDVEIGLRPQAGQRHRRGRSGADRSGCAESRSQRPRCHAAWRQADPRDRRVRLRRGFCPRAPRHERGPVRNVGHQR